MDELVYFINKSTYLKINKQSWIKIINWPFLHVVWPEKQRKNQITDSSFY